MRDLGCLCGCGSLFRQQAVGAKRQEGAKEAKGARGIGDEMGEAGDWRAPISPRPDPARRAQKQVKRKNR